MLGRLSFGVACDLLRRRRASRTLLFVTWSNGPFVEHTMPEHSCNLFKCLIWIVRPMRLWGPNFAYSAFVLKHLDMKSTTVHLLVLPRRQNEKLWFAITTGSRCHFQQRPACKKLGFNLCQHENLRSDYWGDFNAISHSWSIVASCGCPPRKCA